MSVIATLNIGSNGATSKSGNSQPLSTEPDRRRFLDLHRSAGAYVLGRNSFAAERYTSSSAPILILSRSLEEVMGATLVTTSDLAATMREIAKEYPHPILVEAGVSLLKPLIECGAIEELYLSLSPIDGDGDFVDKDELLSHFEVATSEEIEGTHLLKCRYKGDSAYSKSNS